MADSKKNESPPHEDATSQESHGSVAARQAMTPAAARALAEAEERRRRAAEAKAQQAAEVGGRGGLDPARYGDWEVKGIASDF